MNNIISVGLFFFNSVCINRTQLTYLSFSQFYQILNTFFFFLLIRKQISYLFIYYANFCKDTHW
ncbi:hypothetical protein BDF20DRAFT_890733 [Mycotypha africana]|uniref:uncharacterized protein n=1 Tax=Mycotypha africana TaxID=64632 RepID=UPI00230087D2|nr:uncharacterized protein BDF20DRAFT_890733 [Mycotypha africana]KAI8970345.1 hypothetical protein BDF20DRAFT_890733 [Mycotypha africana]